MRFWQKVRRGVLSGMVAWPVVVILTFCWLLPLPALENPGGNMQWVPVTLAGKKIRVAMANTSESRIQGLLGWNSINEEQGMLLDFLSDTAGAIHMQGMKFPIDAIWVDSKGEIKLIYEEIQPNSGLVYPSMVPCRYCLEVKAGFCKKFSVQVGQKMRFGDD